MIFFVHLAVGAAQPDLPCRGGIVVWAVTLAGFAYVSIVDMAAAGAAIALVCVDAIGVCLLCTLPCHDGMEGIQVGVWLHGAGLLLQLAPGLMLSVSSGSATHATRCV